jgi:hypothetical protein
VNLTSDHVEFIELRELLDGLLKRLERLVEFTELSFQLCGFHPDLLSAQISQRIDLSLPSQYQPVIWPFQGSAGQLPSRWSRTPI